MIFCPLCENLLIFQNNQKINQFKCRNCTYDFPLLHNYSNKIKFEKKRNFEEIFKNQENLPKITVNCPSCSHNEAFYFQMQTRSADEASTIFYRCTKCQFNWKE